MYTFFQENFIFPSHTKSHPDTKPRLEYIDLAKGICIILVVILHHDITAFDLPGLEILRMPLYFFLSGLFFKRYDTFSIFLKKKVNNLIIPCIFFEICYIIPKSLLNTLPSEDIILHVLLIKIINSPLWFLISLFSINILYYFIAKIGKEWVTALFIILCGTSGYMLSILELNPWYIGSSLSAAPLFYAGHLFNQKRLLFKVTSSDKSNKCIYTSAITSLIVFMGIIIAYQYYDLPKLHLWVNDFSGNPIMFYMISIVCVISFINICSIIKWLPIISYFGRYSIITLGIHQILHYFATAPLYWITGNTPTNIMILIMTLTVCWFAIPVFKKFFPYFTAQKHLFDLIGKQHRASDRKVSLS